MSRAAVAKELVAAQARALKIPGLGRVYEALARQAREEHWGYEEYLHELRKFAVTNAREFLALRGNRWWDLARTCEISRRFVSGCGVSPAGVGTFHGSRSRLLGHGPSAPVRVRRRRAPSCKNFVDVSARTCETRDVWLLDGSRVDVCRNFFKLL